MYKEIAEFYVKIRLENSDKFAIVSKEDYELVSGHKWYLNFCGYIQCYSKSKTILMHRMIMGIPTKQGPDKG